MELLFCIAYNMFMLFSIPLYLQQQVKKINAIFT